MVETEIDFGFIEEKMREVLKNAHSDPRKWNIKDFPDRINFSCPICGDSKKDPNKKRANIYKDNPLFMVCFNEGCKASVNKLFTDFNVQISPDKKQQMYDYVDSHVKFNAKKDVYIPEKLDKMINLDEFVEHLNNNPQHKIKNFKPIQKNSKQYQYLAIDRLITNFDNIYQADYIITDKWFEKVIVLLNKSGNKILGMQIRNLKTGDNRLFKIYNFESLYRILYPDIETDDLEMVAYNKISNFFNILNVDWEQPVTIFEGYLDSIFFPNSIGAIGLNSIDTDLDFLFDAGLTLRFFLDQDIVGIKNAINLLKQGYCVFLWQLLNNKLVEDLKGDNNVLRRKVLEIKDLNQLVQIFKVNVFEKFELEKYFSSSMMDMFYLDFKKYPQKKFKKYD